MGEGALTNAKELVGTLNLMRFLLWCSNNNSSSCCRSGVKSPTHQKSPSTPNFVSAPCRSGTKKQKTPSTGDLYKYLSLSYDSTSPKKFAGLVLKFFYRLVFYTPFYIRNYWRNMCPSRECPKIRTYFRPYSNILKYFFQEFWNYFKITDRF